MTEARPQFDPSEKRGYRPVGSRPEPTQAPPTQAPIGEPAPDATEQD